MSDEKPKKARIPFEQAIEALCEKYGYADWAVVARAVDSAAKGWWVAGTGRDPAGDRERALILHGEMAVLQETIVAHLKAPVAKI